MSGRDLALAAVFLAAAGCTSIEKADARPGGLVWTENTSIGWMPSGLASPGRAGTRGWIFVRVIAPTGATECRAESGLFDGPNPYKSGKPGPDRAALLTVRDAAAQSVFICMTAGGEVRRETPSTKITYTVRGYYGKKDEERSYWSVPPLVHVNPKDADADKHWAAVSEEVCPASGAGRGRNFCKPGMLDKMKAVDLGASAG
jgi:hypothetical protein